MNITADGGATWSAVDTGAKVKLRAMAALDAGHAIVVGDGGLILATDDGGKTWRERNDAKNKHFTPQHLLALSAVGNQLWTSGFDGALWHSVDGGRNWEVQKTGTHMALEDIYFLDADHGWAVGWSGTLLRTLDGGKKWEAINSKALAAAWSLSSVYFHDLKNGWAAGFSGQLLRSRDGGATWEAQDSSSKSWLKDIEFDSSNRGWITSDEQFLVSEDGGEKWNPVKIQKNLFLRKLLHVGDSLWAVGQLGVLKQGPGLTWTPVTSLVPRAASQVVTPQK